MVSPPSRTDVLIIGAGPSGLMAAQALARLGVDVRVVDKRTPDAIYGNADGLQPHTLAIWQSYDLFENIARVAVPVHALVTYEQDHAGGLVRSKPSPNMVVDCRYPYEMAVGIKYIEGTLRDAALSAGAVFMQPYYPISFEISSETTSHPVKMKICRVWDKSLENPSVSNTETISAKYLIGADGAHSFVRKCLGIVMEGESTEYVWGVADVRVKTDFPDCHFKCIIQSARGAVIIIPREDERVRIYVQLSSKDDIWDSEGRLDRTLHSPEFVERTVLHCAQEGLSPFKFEFTQVFWSTIFSVPHRVANRFSHQHRAFIMGDACHTHSPKAGQGANASMGDAHNLAWKIAYVLRGWANESLLATYEDERRQYAKDLITFDKVISASLDGRTAAEYRAMLHKQNMFSSGVGICYGSRLTLPSEAVRVPQLTTGARMPTVPLIRLGDWRPMELQDLFPSDGRFKLFLFAQNIKSPKRKHDLESFELILRSEGLTPSSGLGEGRLIITEASPTSRTFDGAGGVQMLSTYTILASPKEDIHWNDVPASLQSWARVFVVEGATTFGVVDQGFAVLVRPDGYITTVSGMSGKNARHVVQFLRTL